MLGKLGQGNIFRSVCQEFCTRGGSASVHAWILPGGRLPPVGADQPGSRHPLPQADPPVQCMLGDMVNKHAVCILLECNLLVTVFSWMLLSFEGGPIQASEYQLQITMIKLHHIIFYIHR